MPEESTRVVILVVEDDPRVRELLVDVLSNEGYDVISAANGDEALTTIGTIWPALITLDLDLPGISGAVILQALRQRDETRGLPVVIVSANMVLLLRCATWHRQSCPNPLSLMICSRLLR